MVLLVASVVRRNHPSVLFVVCLYVTRIQNKHLHVDEQITNLKRVLVPPTCSAPTHVYTDIHVTYTTGNTEQYTDPPVKEQNRPHGILLLSCAAVRTASSTSVGEKNGDVGRARRSFVASTRETG